MHVLSLHWYMCTFGHTAINIAGRFIVGDWYDRHLAKHNYLDCYRLTDFLLIIWPSSVWLLHFIDSLGSNLNEYLNINELDLSLI